MHHNHLSVPLTPSRGNTLRVVLVCRISTVHQNEQSLSDQENLLRKWLESVYQEPVAVSVIATRGSGEALDRPELQQLIDLVTGHHVDLVLAEDLGRICRRIQALIFCEDCEDHDVRVIALNDHLDTASGDWRMSGVFASMRHESSNKDTSLRIKRSLSNRFEKGGVVQTHIFGYIKPLGAQHDSELQKDPAAEPIYEKWLQILEAGGTYSDVADFLNASSVPLGPWCRTGKWTPGMVSRITRNPILKGLRLRNRKMSVRVNKSGRYKSIDAPAKDLLTRKCPHLAFIESERYDPLIRQLNERNACFRRVGTDGVDPRRGVPRKRTRWPGRHLTCGQCGTIFVYGAHGQKEHLMCSAAREYRCWMSISIDSSVARRKLLAAIWSTIQDLPHFNAEWREALETSATTQAEQQQTAQADLQRREVELNRKISNLQNAIREFGPSKLLGEDLQRLEKDQQSLQLDRDQLLRLQPIPSELPSREALQALIGETLEAVGRESQDAARLLRQMISAIVLRPYRLVDGGQIVLRAFFTLDIAAAWPTVVPQSELLRRELGVELFEPPQREKFRREVMRRRQAGQTERQIAGELGLTITAVQRAATLQRLMDSLGIQEAYQPVTEPPPEHGKLRRHRHARFEQQPPTNRPAA